MRPAALAATGITLALLLARRSEHTKRLQSTHPKIARAITTLAAAVQDTDRLFHRGSWVIVLGVTAYLGFDVLILWSAFLALHAHPVPPFPVVIMAYVIGALGGSIPLPGAAGTIGGMAGTLILYGVAANAALATVLVHQAIGLLVPLVGGAIAYAVIRRRLGPVRASAANDPVKPPTSAIGG